MEAENCPREKKFVNIAQKMLTFQAETSLFLMRKTTQRERERERERGNEKDEKKDRKKERWRSQKSKD